MKKTFRSFIGIDPGEMWTGIVFLYPDVEDNRWRVETGVIKEDPPYRSVHVIEDLLNRGQQRRSFERTVVIERYTVRPSVGWRDAATLKLVGAIERTVLNEPGTRWIEAPAGPPSDVHKMMGFGSFMNATKRHWPHQSDLTWQHARSAWRVLGYHFMREEVDLLNLKLVSMHAESSSAQRPYWSPVSIAEI